MKYREEAKTGLNKIKSAIVNVPRPSMLSHDARFVLPSEYVLPMFHSVVLGSRACRAMAPDWSVKEGAA